jgi:hypothetical protein
MSRQFNSLTELQQYYQFDEINSAKNSFQVKYKMKKSVEVQTLTLLSKTMLRKGRSKNLLIVLRNRVLLLWKRLLWKRKMTILVMELTKEQQYHGSLIISI